MQKNIFAVVCLGTAILAGCGKVKSGTVQADATPPAAAENSPASAPTPAPAPVTIPSGSSFHVRLQEAIDTQRNRAGDRFTAVLDEPLVSGDRVVVPKGTIFHGHIAQSQASGRLKGNAALGLMLDSFTLNGRTHNVSTTDYERTSAGHKKHNLAWIGGGSGAGALIGAAAGGGAGALIGAGAGAAAGTVGSAITGKREIKLPVETRIRFTLEAPVEIR